MAYADGASSSACRSGIAVAELGSHAVPQDNWRLKDAYIGRRAGLPLRAAYRDRGPPLATPHNSFTDLPDYTLSFSMLIKKSETCAQFSTNIEVAMIVSGLAAAGARSVP